MKKMLSVIFAIAMLATTGALAIPMGAADYKNESYWRYPASATYEALGEAGFARGMLTVKSNDWVNNNADGCLTDAVAFWANAEGPLEGYSHLARFKMSTRSTTYTFPELQIIPEGADRLRVYTAINGSEKLSEKYADAMLPENWDYIPAGKPLKRFVVVSDTHLTDNDTAHSNKIFKQMLKDVNEDFSDVSGIFINGDNVNSTSMFGTTGTAVPKKQLEMLKAYGEEICPEIPIFMAVGNHDLWPTGDRESLKQIFTSIATLPDGSHPSSIHYDFWLDNCHFVMIGDDDGDPNYATLTSDTLKWLDETLAEGYEKEGTRTFIFLHQALSDTVAGSLTDLGQEWDGVVNAVEVRAVLRKYPEAILFSGHSHYSMDSVRNSFSGGLFFPTTFNTASLANVGAADGYKDNDEAQGYIIEVYENAVFVRGYDFAHDEWKASAQYMVDYGAEQGERPIFPESKPNENEANGSNNNSAEKATEKATNKPTDPATDTQGDTSESGATDEVRAEGCGAAVSAGAASIAAAAVASAVCASQKSKKKKND